MGKEKHPSIEQERKDLTFYYEIIGLFSLIIPILALARLGVVGFYIMLTFRIVFGDWYFLILIALIAFGIRSLLVHKPLNWKNVRTIGILMILIGIMILSIFTMHNFIQNYGTDYLSMTMSLYLDYFKTTRRHESRRRYHRRFVLFVLHHVFVGRNRDYCFCYSVCRFGLYFA